MEETAQRSGGQNEEQSDGGGRLEEMPHGFAFHGGPGDFCKADRNLRKLEIAGIHDDGRG